MRSVRRQSRGFVSGLRGLRTGRPGSRVVSWLNLLPELERRLAEQRERRWSVRGHRGQDLFGKTLGVIGMGRIGYALARRCHGG